MSATENLSTPAEIDTHLAELHRELASARNRLASASASIFRMAGARRSYGRRGGLDWDMSFEEASEKVRGLCADESYIGRNAEEVLATFHDARGAAGRKAEEIEKVQELYTGWSRFFVVTSSQGHIHSSMHCNTCYDSTTFGWLPHLSGKTEAEAVEACGPALCSVCFSSAPVEHQGGKISTDDAAKLANGITMAQIQAERDAAKNAKAEAKRQKAIKAGERAKKLMAKVEAFYAEHGGFHAVMAMDLYGPGGIYQTTDSLQSTVQDTIMDDHREFHGDRRDNKNPREAIVAGEEAAA